MDSEFIQTVNLIKHKLVQNKAEGIQCQLDLCLDVSGSMQDSYRKGGPMDQLMERFIALASIVDPDKKCGVTVFDSFAHTLSDMEIANYSEYLDKIRYSNSYWNSTNYAAALNAVSNKHSSLIGKIASGFGFFKKPAILKQNPPKFICFFTDGSPDSESEARRAIYELADSNVYIQFIGYGSQQQFSLISDLANELNHVGFAHYPTLSISNEEFMNKFFHDEAINWIKGKMQ